MTTEISIKADPEATEVINPLKNRRMFVVNGIHAMPSDNEGWTDRVARALKSSSWYVRAMEYFTPFLMGIRSLINAHQRDLLVTAALSNRWQFLQHVVVGHSNGADIICDAIRVLNRLLDNDRKGNKVFIWKPLSGYRPTPSKSTIKYRRLLSRKFVLRGPVFDEVHLVAGAVEHDFDKNGLNEALANGIVGKVYIYCSKRDTVLKWLARPSRFIFRSLGYGYMGWIASIDIAKLNVRRGNLSKVVIINDSVVKHCDWFKPGKNFARTVEAISNSGHYELRGYYND